MHRKEFKKFSANFDPAEYQRLHEAKLAKRKAKGKRSPIRYRPATTRNNRRDNLLMSVIFVLKSILNFVDNRKKGSKIKNKRRL